MNAPPVLPVMAVTVYTSGPSCMACQLTKRHLKKLGIAFQEVPIDEAVLLAADELSLTRAPIVCASGPGGEQYWDGYRPDRIDGLAA